MGTALLWPRLALFSEDLTLECGHYATEHPLSHHTPAALSLVHRVLGNFRLPTEHALGIGLNPMIASQLAVPHAAAEAHLFREH